MTPDPVAAGRALAEAAPEPSAAVLDAVAEIVVAALRSRETYGLLDGTVKPVYI